MSLTKDISSVCENVKSRQIDLLAFAHDASHYLLKPKLVAVPKDAAEVAAVIKVANKNRAHITFRSGGTSLSGQAGTDEVLIDTRSSFRKIVVGENGLKVTVEPGATLLSVNARLARHKRVLGPDPASIVACTIGGIIANNSSGITCGTHANTYKTLDSLQIILPSGTQINTGEIDADEKLKISEPEIYAGLIELRDRIRSNPESTSKIAQLYSIKNTMGYGLNSFIDFDRPIDILAHLIVGSEGTLAFVAEAVFNTLPQPAHFATGLLFFSDFASACDAIPELIDANFGAIEILDAAALRVAQKDPKAPQELLDLEITNEAALLVEIRELTPANLSELTRNAQAIIDKFKLVTPAKLDSDWGRRDSLWHIRRGLYTLVASARPNGTTALLEDIAVPISNLATTCGELMRMFEKHGYDDAVIFGHAKDGNIHFLLNEKFEDAKSLARYKKFTDELVDLVLSQNGTLKAEHGTGRIMAPFVRRQYGDELYEVMRQIKYLIDPNNLLNPGVLISDSPNEHVENLKIPYEVEPEINLCVECGYCENVCPSKDLTLTPRQRIVIRREIKRAEIQGETKLAAELSASYKYDGIETCAVDGMCETYCPVHINTGDLVRNLRKVENSKIENQIWLQLAKNWGLATRVISLALSLAKVLPSWVPEKTTKVFRKNLGAKFIPEYSAALPIGGKPRIEIKNEAPDVIYFSSCTNSLFGPTKGGIGTSDAFIRIADRANLKIGTPENIGSLCCGTPWKSKGLTSGYQIMNAEVTNSLKVATRNGEIPIVCDASSCTEGLEVLLSAAKLANIKVLDAAEFISERALPKLTINKRISSLTIHKTCANVRNETDKALKTIATAISETVIEPLNWSCCAFAGDRGLLHPELTASATNHYAAEILKNPTSAYASTNKTCEIGMSRASSKDYRNILELLEEVTR